MDDYVMQYTLGSGDVDRHRRLRLSVLCTMLQQAADRHVEQLGVGREKTLDRGLLWVLTTHRIVFHRVPVCGERITLRSRPGRTRHVLFPRFARLTGPGGELLAESAALWALMDQRTRSFVFPEEWGVALPGRDDAEALALPRPPKLPALPQQTVVSVPHSWADFNGHMNNARYADLALDLLPAEVHERPLREFLVEHSGEARPGDRLRLHYGPAGGAWYVTGEIRTDPGETESVPGKTERRIFRMMLRCGDCAPASLPPGGKVASGVPRKPDDG